MPGQPARTHARLRISPGNSPSRVASLPPPSPQSSVDKRSGCHVFAEPTLIPKVASRNRKTLLACAETVEGETSLWKSEENRGRNRSARKVSYRNYVSKGRGF
jgi:hypothetical protein